MRDAQAEAEPLLELEEEFVPLRVAAVIAYLHLTERARQVSSDEELADIVHLVAIALSTVAPIERLDGTVLTDADLKHMFYRRLDKAASKPDLESLAIRRGDLKKAMTLLREARAALASR